MKKFLSMLLALVMVLGMAVPAMAATAPEGYTTDDTYGVMAYRFNKNDSYYPTGFYGAYTTFDVMGYHEGAWRSVTYSNRGFSTGVKYDGKFYRVNIEESSENGKYILKKDNEKILSVDFAFKFTNEGKTLKISYIVENLTDREITYSIGSGADIKIGSDDDAPITALGTAGNEFGFMMDSGVESDKSAQFNFFGANRDGVTPVSGFWYGRYSVAEDNLFTKMATKNKLENTDSGCTWHWDDTLEANGTKTFSILLGIGGEGSENVGGSYAIDSDNIITLKQNAEGTIINDFTGADFTVSVGGTNLEEGADKDYTVTDRATSSPKIAFTPAGLAKLGDSANIDIVAVIDNHSIEGSVTYTKSATKYTITAEAEEGGNLSVSATEAEEGDEITITATPAEGYEVWEVTATATDGSSVTVVDNKFTMPASDVKVSARFERIVHTVTFDANGGECATSQLGMMHGTRLNPIPVATKEGCTFDGWFDQDGVKLDENYVFLQPADFVARYTENSVVTHTVTFVANGEVVEVQEVEHGKDAVMPEVPALLLCNGKWDHNGKNITSDLTITAEYALIFDAEDVIDFVTEITEDEEPEEAEVNPSTGAPVFAPVAVLATAAVVLGKKNK